MATGDNLSKSIGRFRTYLPQQPSSTRLASTIAMTSFSSAITQAGMRRREEAKKQYTRGVKETNTVGASTNTMAKRMHGILLEMQGDAAYKMEKFGAAAVKHNLPSIDLKGKPLPPAPALPPELGPPPPPPKSNLPLILGIGAAVLVVVVLLMRQPAPAPAYGGGYGGGYGY